MDIPSGSTASLLASGTKSNGSPSEKEVSDDQCFLLYFTFGMYFGPDLENQQEKSIFQRNAENLPRYTSSQLAGSHIKAVEIERIYYYMTRFADQSLRVKLPLLHQYLHGKCEFDINYPQFPELFPPKLHPYSRFRNRYHVIENIVFINNPETHFLNPEDVKRFKRLTGLQDFLLSRNAATLHTPMSSTRDSSQPEDRDFDLKKTVSGEANPEEKVSHGMIFLHSCPTNQEWSNLAAAAKSAFAVTGTAAAGGIGPVLGVMDIGECEDAYLFRLALPGVKRDEREFSCEVEDNGKVVIRGVTTTGEKRVYRYSQSFEMQSQNLSPPGHFSASFCLPGPVNPQQFSGSFATDGILEGMVMKRQVETDTDRT